MNRKSVGKQVLTITEGIIGNLTDFLLFQTYLPFTLIGKQSPYEIQKGFEEAKEILEDVNYRSIKRALAHLIASGLVSRRGKGSGLEIAITGEGRKRIESMFPVFRQKRPWDKHIYLISYDIPSKANAARDRLREYIRKTGGALLQESLWMNPYNPTMLLNEFSDAHDIPGTILISKLGENGTIGEDDLSDLIRRIYKLDDLAQRYDEFIDKYDSHEGPLSKAQLSLTFLSILKDDPQLPFALEPPDFPAHTAYRLFQTLYSRQ